MLTESVEITFFFSAKILRAGTQGMDHTGIEQWNSMVLAFIVGQAMDELFRQTTRLKHITLQCGTFVGTTIFSMTTARAIVNALVRRRTS